MPDSLRPTISVIMANYNGERFLRRSIASVLSQSCGDLEVLVSDDGSTDDSVSVLCELGRSDGRVRLLSGENGGPASARNRALDAARGDWIAIVDSDDVLHPERFERLIALAMAEEADAVADNLLQFYDDAPVPEKFLFEGRPFDRPFHLTPDLLIRGDVSANGLPNFGYLKPMVKRSRLDSLRYDERLKIGEDFDFLLRLLLAGSSFIVSPEPTYRYRKHAASISHRLSVPAMEEMIAGQLRLEAEFGEADDKLKAAFAKRMATLRRGLEYEKLVVSIKERRTARVFDLLARNPALVTSLLRSLQERISRRMWPIAPAASPRNS